MNQTPQHDDSLTTTQPRVAILGGGPGGYEAALVAARLGAHVTIIERAGFGGSAVLTDVVPSKTLIATAELMDIGRGATELGIRVARDDTHNPIDALSVDLAAVNARVNALAAAQSADIKERLLASGVVTVHGEGRFTSPHSISVTGCVTDDGTPTDDCTVDADIVLIATGAAPRMLPEARPDGRRILTWTQLYHLDEMPTRLIVVGSGVTGAEFAGAYHALGCDVVLVSSRDRVLPGEDEDAARVIDDAFRTRGMTVMSRSRASAAAVVGHGSTEHVEVTLDDGQVITGSHVLMAVGSIPNTADIGADKVGLTLTERGHIQVDKVSRTNVPGVYAAGDCTGVLPLASVAAAQGRIAMSHALGDSVSPLVLRDVAANIFTSPEIATVGWSQRDLDDAGVRYTATTLPLPTNPRAKMMGVHEGFVKLFTRTDSGTVIGGVIVAPRASELIFPVTLAVAHRLTADMVAGAITIYPSLSGSVAETARMSHQRAPH